MRRGGATTFSWKRHYRTCHRGFHSIGKGYDSSSIVRSPLNWFQNNKGQPLPPVQKTVTQIQQPNRRFTWPRNGNVHAWRGLQLDAHSKFSISRIVSQFTDEKQLLSHLKLPFVTTSITIKLLFKIRIHLPRKFESRSFNLVLKKLRTKYFTSNVFQLNSPSTGYGIFQQQQFHLILYSSPRFST